MYRVLRLPLYTKRAATRNVSPAYTRHRALHTARKRRVGRWRPNLLPVAYSFGEA